MLCHHYKCVFVHIPKTAGQSIQRIFLDLLDLTWETRAPLLLRYNDNPELGPPRLSHLKALDYVRYKYMPQEMFDHYFKFAFVRNPWDRMVSIYKYIGAENNREFKSFVMEHFKNDLWVNRHWFVCPQSEFLCDEAGKIKVDFVGRFENLQIDFNYVCQQLGLPPTVLPHANKSQLSGSSLDSPSYQAYYDAESKEFVAELYKSDIALFNYQY